MLAFKVIVYARARRRKKRGRLDGEKGGALISKVIANTRALLESNDIGALLPWKRGLSS